MFRLVVAILAIVGLVSLVSGGVGAAGVGLGVLLIPLLFVAKFVFFLMLFGAFGRMFWYKRQRFGGSAPQEWWGRRPDRVASAKSSSESDFEDWHRMAHAKKEVESWTDGMPVTDENA